MSGKPNPQNQNQKKNAFTVEPQQQEIFVPRPAKKHTIRITDGPIRDHQDYIDQVAMEYMNSMIRVKPPVNIQDAIALARISYKGALCMLQVKLDIFELAEEVKQIINKL
jgi:hypothetical protein